MKVLFEGYKYSSQTVREFLPNHYLDISSELPKPIVVGYHYSNEINCPIIILPKVFLDEENRFFLDKINPEKFLEDDYLNSISDEDTRNQIANFLFECSSWFYFSIKKYFNKYRNTLSIFEDSLNIIDCSHKENFYTEIDIIFSLLKFNKENRDLLLFIKKINKSQNNKIDWNRTIKKTLPTIDSSGSPIYLETLSKKKQINADEELLVLFLSLLKDLERKYKIKIPINPYYNLLSQKEFNKIKRRGTYYLRSIRYKYFDDRLLKLYRLLYTYFENSNQSNIKVNRKEYLIIKDYNLVFEDMVDELLSDTDIPSNLKNQKDGKKVDHIYKSKSFFENDEIYFIGDSKYYKRGNPIENKSIHKQFTYAKNVVQYNIDNFNEECKNSNGIRYRDELSEGYNITPNFFIRGIVKELNHNQPKLTLDENQQEDRLKNKHFPNRLFDRDSLIVQSYSINFLYVLWSYISSNKLDNNHFKIAAKGKFYKCLADFIETNYNFSLITPEISVRDFIKKNFYQLNGRVYRPANFVNNNSFILALNKDETAKEYLSEMVDNYKIDKYELNSN